MIETLFTTSIAVVLWNNNNFHTTPHPEVAYFEIVNEETVGTLVDGTEFTQKNVLDNLGVKFQKFEMQNEYHWVTDRGIIWGENMAGMYPQASNDLQAMSIYLAR